MNTELATSIGDQDEGVPFAESKALYERHLVFDKAVDPAIASPRERFEA